MSKRSELPEDVARLLRRERARPLPSLTPDARSRLRERLRASIQATASAPRSTSPVGRTSLGLRLKGIYLLAIPVVGLLAGVAQHIHHRSPISLSLSLPTASPSSVSAADSAPSPWPPIESTPSKLAEPPATPTLPPLPLVGANPVVHLHPSKRIATTSSLLPTQSVSPPAPTAPTADDSIDAEVAMLGEAREALAKGQGVRALELLTEHEQSFPNGQLREEREALKVRALAETHRVDEARQQLEALEKAFPNSVFLPSIRRSLEEP
jgi:hypothetical protein